LINNIAINIEGHQCVLKRTSVRLHTLGVACVGDKYYKVKENIVKEASILKYLTKLNPKTGLTKLIDFFCDGKNYFLLTEYGGESLLKHVLEFNCKIKEGKLNVNVWKKHVKILFQQMCKFINWLHNIARFAHLDISMENILIKGCVFKNGKFISHGQINFIDFGLAKSFINIKSFDNCTKYVGKESYRSPEIHSKIPFNAVKSDIWSLGVVLFMMTFGVCAYTKPTKTDAMFNIIYTGNIESWAQFTGKSDRASKLLLNLFSHIFCCENKRWSIEDIIKHKYIR